MPYVRAHRPKHREGNMLALSVRQPWAWLIAEGHKDVENRTWETFWRGPLLIHAAKNMTQGEYMQCQRYATERDIELPPRGDLLFGGLIAVARLIECYGRATEYERQLNSQWYQGFWGWHLADVKKIPFTPTKGFQKLFTPDLSEEQLIALEPALAGYY